MVIFNGESSYFEKIKEAHSDFKCHYIPANTPAYARNYGITKASGELVFFIDDDCTLPDNYFSKINFSYDWDVMGGPDRTPLDATFLQKQIGFTLASPLCMGPTFKRHSSRSQGINSHSSEFELILCNLWFKKDLFTKDGFHFDEELFRNEENFLLKQLKLNNKRIFYDPNLYVFHHRKNSIERLGAAIVKSGEYRVKNYLKIPLGIELVYLLPVIFSLLFILWIFNPLSILTPLFLLYIVIVYFFGAFAMKTLNPAFTGLHFLTLFFYTYGLVRELCVQLKLYIKRLLQL